MTTVYEWFGLKTTRMVFIGLASKLGATISSTLASKPAVTIFVGLASKSMTTVFFCLASKLVATVPPDLTSKLVVSFLGESQNQGGGEFSGLALKTGRFGLVIWVSKLSRWFLGLGLKTKWTSVCRLRNKTDVGRSA
jgi:hypothetical protein